jgi:hypothetical protein
MQGRKITREKKTQQRILNIQESAFENKKTENLYLYIQYGRAFMKYLM